VLLREIRAFVVPVETITPDAEAYLYVHVTVADPGASLPLPYVVDVSLMQEVTLPRGVKTRTPLQCPTWSVNRLGLATSTRLHALLSDRVNEFVDQFEDPGRQALTVLRGRVPQ